MKSSHVIAAALTTMMNQPTAIEDGKYVFQGGSSVRVKGSVALPGTRHKRLKRKIAKASRKRNR